MRTWVLTPYIHGPIYIHGKNFGSMYLYLTMLSKRRQVCDTIYIRRPSYGLLTAYLGKENVMRPKS